MMTSQWVGLYINCSLHMETPIISEPAAAAAVCLGDHTLCSMLDPQLSLGLVLEH